MGIVRNVDDLGRIVIPKEMRRTLEIKDGDSIDIMLDNQNGQIILKPMTKPKLKTWRIEVRDETIYHNVEAETEEEAIEMALEWWAERQPRVICDLQ